MPYSRHEVKDLIALLTPLFSDRERRRNILTWTFWGDNEKPYHVSLDLPAIIYTETLINHFYQTSRADLMSLLQAIQERESGDLADQLQPYVEKLRLDLAPPRPKYKLFISYRRKSWDFTHRLVADMRNKISAEIFIDFSSIDSSSFEESILRNLRDSDCVLLVVSEHTFNERIHDPEDWMRREIGEALRLGKPIVLLAHEGRYPPPPDQLPTDIRVIGGRQGIEFYPRFYEEAIDKLVAFIPTAVQNPPDPYQPPLYALPLTEEETVLHDRLIALCQSGSYQAALPLLEHLATLQAQRDKTEARNPFLQKAATNATHAERLPSDKSDSSTHITVLPKPRPTTAEILATDLPFEWVDITAGKVRLEQGGYLARNTLQEVLTFKIAKYPITNAQFEKFIRAKGYATQEWWTPEGWRVCQEKGWVQPRFWQSERWNKPQHPVVGVSWYEAVAFCLWLTECTGEAIMLPTERQWQRAAQGTPNFIYAWGDSFDATRCNYKSDRTTPVTRYAEVGKSPFGVVDMCGNVWELCLTDYHTGNEDIFSSSKGRVRRGGSWMNIDQGNLRAAKRDEVNPAYGLEFVGFRLARTES